VIILQGDNGTQVEAGLIPPDAFAPGSGPAIFFTDHDYS